MHASVRNCFVSPINNHIDVRWLTWNANR